MSVMVADPSDVFDTDLLRQVLGECLPPMTPRQREIQDCLDKLEARAVESPPGSDLRLLAATLVRLLREEAVANSQTQG